MPGYHAVLGMYAFGLEETGDYARAESAGRRAVELEPRDGWAWHAVAHVMEMQNRRRDGVAWLGERPTPGARAASSRCTTGGTWRCSTSGSTSIDEVLKLVDAARARHASPVVLDMIDASAMLWRLQLRGIDVGSALARTGRALGRVRPSQHLRLQRPARDDGLRRRRPRGAMRQRLLAAQARGAAATTATTAMFLRDVGRAATQADPRTSAPAVTPRRCSGCARCAAWRTASAAAMRSAT